MDFPPVQDTQKGPAGGPAESAFLSTTNPNPFATRPIPSDDSADELSFTPSQNTIEAMAKYDFSNPTQNRTRVKASKRKRHNEPPADPDSDSEDEKLRRWNLVHDYYSQQTKSLACTERMEKDLKDLKEMFTALSESYCNLSASTTSLRTENQQLHKKVDNLTTLVRAHHKSSTSTNSHNPAPPTAPTTFPPPLTTFTFTPPQPSPITHTPLPKPTLQDSTWATVVGKGKSNKISTPPNTATPPKNPTPKPSRTPIEQRRLVAFRTDSTPPVTLTYSQVKTALNASLRQAKAPDNILIADINKSEKGNLTLLTAMSCTANDAFAFQETILTTLQKFDPAAKELSKDYHWSKVIIHGIPLASFPDDTEGMESLRVDLTTFNKKINFTTNPYYVGRPENRVGKKHSSCVIAIKTSVEAQTAITHGVEILGRTHRVTKFIANRPSDQCSACQTYGHTFQRCKNDPKCRLCAGKHLTAEHTCDKCPTKGKKCDHTSPKCTNCGALHFANDPLCPNKVQWTKTSPPQTNHPETTTTHAEAMEL
jgi:hypothetical protein